ncbi:MAG: hypothetical protein KDH96_07650, partial [Candidatus Riesia sp.]|nr:hypothetical protein [Candidatus Riesia sp.]
AGLGPKIVKELGSDGVQIAKKLTTEEMILLLKVTPKLKASGRLSSTLAIISKKGFNFVKENPTLVLGGTALGYLSLKDITPQKVGSASGTFIKNFVEKVVSYKVLLALLVITLFWFFKTKPSITHK